jgi:hypothetical protein
MIAILSHSYLFQHFDPFLIHILSLPFCPVASTISSILCIIELCVPLTNTFVL